MRVAFGASERDVVRLILGQGLAVALAGIGLGLAGATALTRVASSFLVGVSATDPITFAGVPALLLAVAIVASFVPARRASLWIRTSRCATMAGAAGGRAIVREFVWCPRRKVPGFRYRSGGRKPEWSGTAHQWGYDNEPKALSRKAQP